MRYRKIRYIFVIQGLIIYISASTFISRPEIC
jgi:hypothetical protein